MSFLLFMTFMIAGWIPFEKAVQASLMQIAKLPDQRRLWLIRKIYGNIPPTDPRFLDLTEEQIDLDIMHYQLDLKARNGDNDTYVDDNFEKYDKETDSIDSVATDLTLYTDEKGQIAEAERSYSYLFADNDSEWEDVEKYDL